MHVWSKVSVVLNNVSEALSARNSCFLTTGQQEVQAVEKR